MKREGIGLSRTRREIEYLESRIESSQSDIMIAREVLRMRPIGLKLLVFPYLSFAAQWLLEKSLIADYKREVRVWEGIRQDILTNQE